MHQKILITGTAGFIGFHLAEALLKEGHSVIGIDNINDYYDPQLKYDRLKESGIGQEAGYWHQPVQSTKFQAYRFIRMNLEDKAELMELCEAESFDLIINLAAQAGVRYSIENPDAYIQSNIVGFLNILEAARHYNIPEVIYASSSSVYGNSKKMPFSVSDNVDHPISLYAATKKSNELMAHTYSHLYEIKTTGLRFFTVYGPWGRPDMAYYLFADAIKNDESIRVFNHGKLKRDFTYIDDIVEGIRNVVQEKNNLISGSILDDTVCSPMYRIFNIGNNKTVELLDFISTIGRVMGKTPEMTFVDMQPGDVYATWADVDELSNIYNYRPSTTIEVGLKQFGEWYLNYTKNKTRIIKKGV